MNTEKRERFLTLGVFLLFVAWVLILVWPPADLRGGWVIGNIDHPGLRGELFHQRDFCENVARGDLHRYYYSQLVSAPTGQSLRQYIGFSLHLLFYIPLLWIKDLVVSYNVLMLLTLALNGFCAFLLGRYVGRSLWAGLICGVMVLLSPYALLKVEMGFLQKTILWWIPLFLLYLLRFLDRQQKRDAILCSLFWAFMLLTYAPYAWYSLFLALIVVGLALARDRSRVKIMVINGWWAAIPAALSVLFLVLVLPSGGLHIDPKPGAMPYVIAAAPNGSVDLFHAFRFYPYHDFFPQIEALPLGISLVGVILAVVAVARRRRYAVTLAAVALFFFAVSLGPYLHNDGHIVSRFPLPTWFLAKYMPWGERLGYSIRALPFFELALALLAALALGETIRDHKQVKAAVVSLCVLALCVAERRVALPELFPVPVTPSELPAGMARLREEGGQVLHVPINIRGNEPRLYSYITARTGTRMMNPYIEYDPEFTVPPLEYPSPRKMSAYLRWLNTNGCDFILVHDNLLSEPEIPMLSGPGMAGPIEGYSARDAGILRAWCHKLPASDGFEFSVYVVPSLEETREGAASPLAWAGLADSLPRPEFTVAELWEHYDTNQKKFARADQVRVHHFFSADVQESQHFLEQLKKEPEGSFKLAADLTARDKQERRWGDIGYVSRGTFSPPIDEALFRMKKPGDTVMVQDADGYHVFLLMDLRPGHEPDFENSIEAVKDSLWRERLTQVPVADSGTNGMVLISGGTFGMGSTEEEVDRAVAMAEGFVGRTRTVPRVWFEDETYRQITVPSFYMDVHEVTVGKYKRFLEAAEHERPLNWEEQAAGSPDLPVTGVTWTDAQDYARWAGKRLPTAEEWEYAARGTARRWFPWGDDWPDGSRANYADKSTDLAWKDTEHNDGHVGLAPVGSYPEGATPEGLLDMAGNAREWTATFRWGVIDSENGHIWSFAQAGRLDRQASSGRLAMMAVKGGAWENAADDMRCSDERILPPAVLLPSMGFRCAQSLPDIQQPATSNQHHTGPHMTLPADFKLPEIVFGGAGGGTSRQAAEVSTRYPVIMVPDLGRDHRDWSGPVYDRFIKAGFAPSDLWLIDFAPAGKQMSTLEEATDDLKLFIAEVMNYTDAPRVQILAHGAGCLLSRLTILKYHIAHWIESEVYIDGPFHGLSPAPDPAESLRGLPNAWILSPGSDLLKEVVARGENPLFRHPFTGRFFRIPTLTLRGDLESPSLLGSWNVALPGLDHDALRLSDRSAEVFVPFLVRDRRLVNWQADDHDRDGFADIRVGGQDFDDGDPSIYPGAPEVLNDGVDQDCNGCDVIGGRDGEIPLHHSPPSSGGEAREPLRTPWKSLLAIGLLLGLVLSAFGAKGGNAQLEDHTSPS